MKQRPARLVHAPEHLDAPIHDPAMLEASLEHVAQVNRWIGGNRSILLHLPDLLPHDGPARVLDVGTGSAAIPRILTAWARRRGIPLAVTATDVHPQIVELARRHTAPDPAITVARADALDLPFPDRSFDVALLSLTLHHFEGDDAIRALRELARVARGILVAELERTWPNYLGARLLAATLWRRNPITRHDGPVSVLRAFTPAELLALARDAGLPRPRVHRHPFYRLVLEARTEAPRATAPLR